MKRCPKCTITVRDEATMCPACGHAFSMFSLRAIAMIVAAGVLLIAASSSLIASLPRKEKIVVAPPVAPFPTRNAFAENLPTLKGPARATTLAALMTRSGQRCMKVERSFYVGNRDGLAFWNVRCAGSGDWMIQVRNDSSITKVACDVHPAIKERCWRPM